MRYADVPMMGNEEPQTSRSETAAFAKETLVGARPPWLDATTANAVTSLVLAAFVTGAALFRAQLASAQFDLIASLLRVLAFTFWVRAFLAALVVVRQWQRDAHAKGARLVLSQEELELVSAGQKHSLSRSEILSITYAEPLPSRTLSPREPTLLMALTPHGGTPRLLAVPPYFAPTTEVLAMRMRRWLELTKPRERASATGEPDDPELHYRRAAAGQPSEGDVVIPEGRGYLLRAPFTALLGLMFALDVLRSAGPLRSALVQPASMAALISLALIAGWFVWMRRKRQSRLGIGMVLTAHELLVRGSAGVVALPWPQVARIAVKVQPRWSPFVGSYPARLLIITTHDQQELLFDDSFLGVPVELVAELCRAKSPRAA